MSVAVSENHVHGILAIPTVSRNGNLYLPQELARQHGKHIPIYLDHEDLETRYDEYGTRIPTGRLNPMKPRGEAVLNWNQKMNQLEFDGEAWDAEAIYAVQNMGYNKVSLAGDPQGIEPFHGVRAPILLDMFSMSFVRDPGIPHTTLNMAAESNGSGPVIAESVMEMAARRFVIMEGNFQMGPPGQQQLSNAPPFSRPPVSNIEPQLARQNSQTMQTGVGIPAGTGVAPLPGINQDPHLGGTGAPGVTGTANVTPMAGLPNQPKGWPAPMQGAPGQQQQQPGQQMCPHSFPMTTECPQCGGGGMAHEEQPMQQQQQPQIPAGLPDLLGYYIVQKLVHGGGMGGFEAFGSASPGAASGMAPAGYSPQQPMQQPQQQQPMMQQQNPDDVVQQHFASCPTCQSVHDKLFGGGKKTSEAELSSAKRDDLSDSKFAYVDSDGTGHLPIPDAAHVRNALARLNQTDMPSSAKAGALAKIHSAAKRFGVDVSEEYRSILLREIEHEMALREVVSALSK